MEMKEFVQNFAEQWDETEAEAFVPECVFHELEEWSSLTGLAILNMLAKKSGVKVAAAELNAAVTIPDACELSLSRVRQKA